MAIRIFRNVCGNLYIVPSVNFSDFNDIHCPPKKPEVTTVKCPKTCGIKEEKSESFQKSSHCQIPATPSSCGEGDDIPPELLEVENAEDPNFYRMVEYYAYK